jgi:hypothetical protein
VAQAVFFVPLLAWASLFGYSKADWFNIIIAILGFYSLDGRDLQSTSHSPAGWSDRMETVP